MVDVPLQCAEFTRANKRLVLSQVLRFGYGFRGDLSCWQGAWHTVRFRLIAEEKAALQQLKQEMKLPMRRLFLAALRALRTDLLQR